MYKHQFPLFSFIEGPQLFYFPLLKKTDLGEVVEVLLLPLKKGMVPVLWSGEGDRTGRDREKKNATDSTAFSISKMSNNQINSLKYIE